MSSGPNDQGSDLQQKQEEAKQTIFHRAKAWGDSPLPPALLATLIVPQHITPRIQYTPLLFPPVLLFASYANLNGYVSDSAGISAAWSGIYAVLALRRKQAFISRFGTRGVLRGATLALAAVNVVGGGVSYTFGEKGRAANWIGKGQE